KKINKQSIFYHYQIETKPRVSERERRTVAAGRFILATNIESSSDLHCSEILWNYKTDIPQIFIYLYVYLHFQIDLY
ncbi:MAG: hypothetical protein O4965_11770, partial [Trichodesmium sp. St19_bin1]|nr:hypothetical protein [Trichodesmium sp. St19_bin1]